MNLKNILVIWVLFIVRISGSDCEDGFVNINDNCYYKNHVKLLQGFIDNNESLYKLNPLDIGFQEWNNDKLIHLYLGNLNINIIPNILGEIKDIKSIDLSNNNILSLPETLCNIFPYYTDINFSNNQICPPYPFCFEYIDNQNNNECPDFNCTDDYININNKCYYKRHIQVLEDLIELNNSLNNNSPLNIGSEIGFQKWKNGKLTHLNLINNNLTKLPENLCQIYSELEFFNIANNNICPPYPSCFEFIGFQNTYNCIDEQINDIYENDVKKNVVTELFENNDEIYDSLKIAGWQAVCPIGYIKYDNKCYLQTHIDLLQDFIDNNIILKTKDPLEIGYQDWNNSQLINLNLMGLEINTIPDSIGLLKNINSLDLSNNNISLIPEGLCSLYNNKTSLNLSKNKICSSFPPCLDYVSEQDCKNHLCPDGFKKINDDCIFIEDLNFLSSLIDSNQVLSNILGNLDISESYKRIGYQAWRHGRLDTLIIHNTGLTQIPENICKINKHIRFFNVDYNSICPPYPSCYISFQNQNLSNCNILNLPQLSCPDSCVSYYNKCYKNNNLSVLNDFITNNESLTNYHPLSVGAQVWKNYEIIEINLNEMGLTKIPESIYKLDGLKKINLSYNNLKNLPESFCKVYSKLENLNLNNNNICEPFIDCFDFIGNQKPGVCKENKSCSFGYVNINDGCYYKKDIEILNQFINNNISLNNKGPLEIGIQKWNNMQLEYLYLGESELTDVPDGVCSILPQLKGFNISQNKICYSYPSCVESFIGEQNKSNCD